MYFINVNVLGSQWAHNTNDLVCYVGLKMTDWWVETCNNNNNNNNIFIYRNWFVTRWQWLFYMYTKHEIGY